MQPAFFLRQIQKRLEISPREIHAERSRSLFASRETGQHVALHSIRSRRFTRVISVERANFVRLVVVSGISEGQNCCQRPNLIPNDRGLVSWASIASDRL